MVKMTELYELGTEQGYLEYEAVVKQLREENKFMRDQIEDLIQVLEDLGIEVRRRK